MARPPLPAPTDCAARLRTLLLVVSALLLPGGCGKPGEPSAPPATGPKAARAVPVTVTPVARGALLQRVEGTGSLEAYQVVAVAARLDGVVEAVTVEEGDAVDPTRSLAVIDGTRRTLERTLARAAVDEAAAQAPRALAALGRAEAGVERARAQQRAAQTDLTESEDLLKRRERLRTERPGVVPDEEIVTSAAQVARRRDALLVAGAALSEAQAAVAQAQADQGVATQALASAGSKLALAEKLLADTAVHTPIAGVVRRRHVTLGQYVRAGDPLVEIVDRSRLRARFRVTEAESVRLATDQRLSVSVPALSGAEHPARLIHVDETANPVSRMVECLAELTGPTPGLKPGFFVLARVEVRAEGVLHVPEGALLPGDLGWVAYVVEDGRAKRRVLSLGLRTKEGEVEILDGATEGESLIVGGANVVSDGQAVTPTPLVRRDADGQAPGAGPGPR